MNPAIPAAAVHTAHILAGRTVRCDYAGCVSVGSCEHSRDHTWNGDCSTCSHDLRATCMIREEVKCTS